MAESTPPMSMLDYEPPPPSARLDVRREAEGLVITLRRPPLWRDVLATVVAVAMFSGCLTGVALIGRGATPPPAGRTLLIAMVVSALVVLPLLLVSRLRTEVFVSDTRLKVTRGRATLFECGREELTEFAVVRTIGDGAIGTRRPYLQARRGGDAFMFKFTEDLNDADAEWIAVTVRRTLGCENGTAGGLALPRRAAEKRTSARGEGEAHEG